MTSEAETRREASMREAPSEGRWLWIYSAFFFVLPVEAVVAPRSVVVLLLAAALLALVWLWRGKAARPWAMLDRGLAFGLGVLVLWTAIASLWSFDPPRSLLLSLRIAFIFAAALVLHAMLRAVGDTRDRPFGPWLIAGICIGLGIMVAELTFGFPLGYLLHDASRLAGSPAVWLNRGAVALALLCWPAAAMLWGGRSKWAAVALTAAVLGVLSFLDSESAIAGLAAGIPVAVLGLVYPKAGRALLAAATLAVMVGSPFIAKQLYAFDWQSADWLPSSAQHRVEIWNYTVDRIAEKPLFGWGFDSARHMVQLPAEAEASGRFPNDWHSHNAPLQILLEIGPVGTAITLGLAWLLIQRLEDMAPPGRAFGQAAYISALTMACTAYGVWQNWWLALMCCAALTVAATAKPAPVS